MTDEQITTETPKTTKSSKKKKILVRLFLALLLFFVLLISSLSWLVGTHSGLKTLVFSLPEKFGVHIEAKQLHGTLWKGFGAQDISINTKIGDEISLSNLTFDWDSSQLLKNRLLHIHKLELGKLHIIKIANRESKKTTSNKLPDDIGLPLKVKIDNIISRGVLLGKDILLNDAQLTYSYLDKKHQADIVSINTIWGQIKGQAQLVNQTPFPLSGNIDLHGVINQESADGIIKLSGSLNDIVLQGELASASALWNSDIKLSPFAENAVERIHHISVYGANINPRDFLNSAPQANLAFITEIKPDETAQQLNGILSLFNENPRAYDLGGLPVSKLYGELNINDDSILSLNNIALTLINNGEIKLNGTVADELNLQVALNDVSLSDIISKQSSRQVNGNVSITGKIDEPIAKWQLSQKSLSANGTLLVQSANNGKSLNISQADFSDGNNGIATLSGRLDLFESMPLNIKLESRNFNPEVIGDIYPKGKINGNLSINGTLKDTPNLDSKLSIKNSVLSGMPLLVNGDLHYQKQHLSPSKLDISLGDNKIFAEGTFGHKNDRLNINVHTPSLNQFGLGLQGALNVQGFVAGDIDSLNIQLKGNANKFAYRDYVSLQQLNFDLISSPNLHAPLSINIDGQNLLAGSTEISHINTNAKGTLANHNINAQASINTAGKPYRANIIAAGGFNKDYQWNGNVSQLNLSDSLDVVLESPVSLTASKSLINLGAARWRVLGGLLNLQSLNWKEKQGFLTKGNAQNIQLSHLKNIVDIPVEQNLVLSGDWDIQYNENMRGYLNVNHQSGDIIIPNRTKAIGIKQFSLKSNLSNNRINNTIVAVTDFGNADAQLSIAQNFGDKLLKSPISGSLKLNNVDLNKLKYFLPPDTGLGGQLELDTQIKGSLSDPLISGSLNAQKLYYREREMGIFFTRGTLKSHFDGNRWLIDSLHFDHNSNGSIDVSGEVSRAGIQPNADLNVSLKTYPVVRHADRRVVMSGDAKIRYSQNGGLILVGGLKLDEATIDFPKSGMPSLSDDVVVVGQTEKDKEATPMLLAIDLGIDLNNAFRFSGKGLDVLMGGELQLKAQPKEEIRLIGAVNVVSGRYKAYGQDLEIDRGQIAFMGPMDNPSLNVRAKRRLSPVGAGVEVTGTLSHPRVVLIADDPMSDKDKLAWLVLGRGATSGDDAALAAAMGTMLAGGINDKIGLVDDIGLTGRSTRNDTGEVNPAEQMVTIGKHLTSRIYLGYEYGLSSTTQAVKLIFQLGRSIQLIGRAGTDSSGGEIRYTTRFD
ncbi:MAG: translocation/assembly module TamB domain-containing protein [Neisseriaceae bacterium]|nr:translocation/assembly module TamB domain-containing protein [Neisseriaceae bacterium]